MHRSIEGVSLVNEQCSSAEREKQEEKSRREKKPTACSRIEGQTFIIALSV
jgi:hypothetical protein